MCVYSLRSSPQLASFLEHIPHDPAPFFIFPSSPEFWPLDIKTWSTALLPLCSSCCPVAQCELAVAHACMQSIKSNYLAPPCRLPLFFSSFTQCSMPLKYHQLCTKHLWPCSQTIKAGTDTVLKKRESCLKRDNFCKKRRKDSGEISSSRQGASAAN